MKQEKVIQVILDYGIRMKNVNIRWVKSFFFPPKQEFRPKTREIILLS